MNLIKVYINSVGYHKISTYYHFVQLQKVHLISVSICVTLRHLEQNFPQRGIMD